MTDTTSFAHLLIFACPQCGQPAVKAVMSDMSSLEYVDAMVIPIQCECGWSRQVFGMEAARHLVVPWSVNAQHTERDLIERKTEQEKYPRIASPHRESGSKGHGIEHDRSEGFRKRMSE